MWVDEGVEVGVNGFVVVVIVSRLGHGNGLDWGGHGGDGGGLGNEWGGVLSVSSGGNVSALQDPEAVLAGGVPHGDGLAVLVDVAVLADPLPVSSRLLPEHSPVLLGEG